MGRRQLKEKGQEPQMNADDSGIILIYPRSSAFICG